MIRVSSRELRIEPIMNCFVLFLAHYELITNLYSKLTNQLYYTGQDELLPQLENSTCSNNSKAHKQEVNWN